ncbi:hypothetical protein BSL78_30008 [Apostichopus japonicus]|uniref:Ig-like domain-containing protein n=1 Tax=Stichopus japonicus TaxID=307972 RepID=A0A2G8JBQ5_STIJA|nr:hypothetical protein BSL78_30008 [Apostichopus japonicus]
MKILELSAIIFSVMTLSTFQVFAEPTISTRLLQSQNNSITLVCETDSPLKPEILLSLGDKIVAHVDGIGDVLFPNSTQESCYGLPDVTTFEVNGLHVGISFPRLLVNEQGFTCTSIISSSEFRFQTNIESLVPVVATGIHPTKDLGINVNPGYVLFSQDTYNRSGIQFLCTSNFESSDTQAFRWSMESKKTGHELFDDDLTILIERQISIQVNTSSKQSILTLEGLDFPSVPDDFIVTCSSRLNDGTTPVSASSTIRIKAQTTVMTNCRDPVSGGLYCTVVDSIYYYLWYPILLSVRRGRNLEMRMTAAVATNIHPVVPLWHRDTSQM